MSNMSYCRFENTVSDLRDCADALRNGEAEDEDLSSDYERSAKHELIALCREIAAEFGEQEDEREEEEIEDPT